MPPIKASTAKRSWGNDFTSLRTSNSRSKRKTISEISWNMNEDEVLLSTKRRLLCQCTLLAP